jgi:putative two-component system response regulator
MTDKKKILIVDDSPAVLQLEEVMLTRAYDVVRAETGGQALQMAIEHRPDLILLDIMMPKIDGFEVCRLLRNIPSTKDIPIIIVTALGDKKAEHTAYSVGATDYLTKPIDRAALLAKVDRCMALVKREPTE